MEKNKAVILTCKNSWGGKRPNSGRKKGKTQTETLFGLRFTTSEKEKIMSIIKKEINEKKIFNPHQWLRKIIVKSIT